MFKETSQLAICILAMILIALSPATSGAEEFSEDWEPAVKDGDIRIYTRSVRDSSYKEFKAITTLQASSATVMAIFTEQSANKQWLAECTDAEVLEYSDFHSQIAYQAYNFPWPASDRDFVIEFDVRQTGKSNFLLRMHDRSEHIGEKASYVRAELKNGYYRIKQLSPEKTRVTMVQHVNPGGSLPAWMVNQLITDTPYYSLKNLRKLVLKSPYSEATFVRNNQGEVTDVAL